MLIIDLPNTNPLSDGEGLAIKLESQNLASVSELIQNNIDYCQYECEYIEPVFANVGGDWWENDKNSFLFQKVVSADTITIQLWKGNEKVADISDDTYGTYYSSFTNQPLYRGFIVEWEKVFDEEGAGLYQIKADLDIMGNASTFESHRFQLLPYSDILANGTVRIESYQTGNILASEFDYTDLLDGGWYNSFRIKGFFGFKTPKLEIDNYLNQDYKQEQIQDKVSTEWTLETNLLPSYISNVLAYDNILANKLLITDYNIFNTEIFRRIEVYPQEFGDVSHYANNRNTKFIIIFTNKIDNNIKTNF